MLKPEPDKPIKPNVRHGRRKTGRGPNPLTVARRIERRSARLIHQLFFVREPRFAKA
jgi:hypothetical protein